MLNPRVRSSLSGFDLPGFCAMPKTGLGSVGLLVYWSIRKRQEPETTATK
jgi:hypothetical protein